LSIGGIPRVPDYSPKLKVIAQQKDMNKDTYVTKKKAKIRRQLRDYKNFGVEGDIPEAESSY